MEADREHELNQVEDQFIAELFRLTRLVDPNPLPGVRQSPEEEKALAEAQELWDGLRSAQHRRILAKCLACLSLPNPTYFQDAATFLIFVQPSLSPVLHGWVEQSLRDTLNSAPSDLVSLHKVLLRALYSPGGYSRAHL